MDITFVTTAGNNEDAFALLSALGFPFKEQVTLSDLRMPRSSCKRYKSAIAAGLEIRKKDLHG